MIKKTGYSIIFIVLLFSICYIIRERKISNLILHLVHSNELEQYKLLNDTVSSSNYEIVPLQAYLENGEHEFKNIWVDKKNNQYIVLAVAKKNNIANKEYINLIYKINLNGFITDTLSINENTFFENGFLVLSDSTYSNWIYTGDKTNIINLRKENQTSTLSEEQFANRFWELYDKCESTNVDISYSNNQWIYCFYFPNEVIQLFEDADKSSFETNYFENNNIKEKRDTIFSELETDVVTNISTDYFHYINRFGMTLSYNTAPHSYPDPTFRGVCYFTLLHNREPLKFKAEALYEVDKVNFNQVITIGYPPYKIINISDILFINCYQWIYLLRRKKHN